MFVSIYDSYFINVSAILRRYYIFQVAQGASDLCQAQGKDSLSWVLQSDSSFIHKSEATTLTQLDIKEGDIVVSNKLKKGLDTLSLKPLSIF